MEIEIPKVLQDVPIFLWNDWCIHKGETYFAMVNIDKSTACNRPIIDLCYCATAGLINGRVLKSVNYIPENFQQKIFVCPSKK